MVETDSRSSSPVTSPGAFARHPHHLQGLIDLIETKCGHQFSPPQGSAKQAREHIRSIPYLKSHAAQISEAVTTTGAPFIITQNGEAAMVIEGMQQYQEKEDLIALRKLPALGEKDRQAGLGLSVEASRGHRMAITGPTLLDLNHAHPSPSPHCGQPGRLASAAIGPFAA